jgi:hypothetical protein
MPWIPPGACAIRTRTVPANPARSTPSTARVTPKWRGVPEVLGCGLPSSAPSRSRDASRGFRAAHDVLELHDTHATRCSCSTRSRIAKSTPLSGSRALTSKHAPPLEGSSADRWREGPVPSLANCRGSDRRGREPCFVPATAYSARTRSTLLCSSKGAVIVDAGRSSASADSFAGAELAPPDGGCCFVGNGSVSFADAPTLLSLLKTSSDPGRCAPIAPSRRDVGSTR